MKNIEPKLMLLLITNLQEGYHLKTKIVAYT